MSTKKQGATSYKETAFGVIPRGELIPLEIKGIKRAWDFVLQKHRTGKISITPILIKKLHEIGFGWIFPKMGGKFRQVEVTVSNHNPPKFYLLEQLILSFCKDLKHRIEFLPVIDAPDFLDELTQLLSWAQHRFLWIHPFQDYNGRIGRLITNVILLNLNLPPIELKIETKITRKAYIQALQAADKGSFSKLNKIVKFALSEAAKGFDN